MSGLVGKSRRHVLSWSGSVFFGCPNDQRIFRIFTVMSSVICFLLRLIFFLFEFFGPSILCHSFWTESIVRWVENGISPRKTTWPPTSRTWLVLLVTCIKCQAVLKVVWFLFFFDVIWNVGGALRLISTLHLTPSTTPLHRLVWLPDWTCKSYLPDLGCLIFSLAGTSIVLSNIRIEALLLRLIEGPVPSGTRNFGILCFSNTS